MATPSGFIGKNIRSLFGVTRQRPARKQDSRSRPQLELLQDRIVPANPAIGDVFYIELENHNLTQPSGLSGPVEQLLNNPAAPYLNSLMTPGNPNAAQTAYASNYYNVMYNNPAVSIHPSEPNYVWQEAGLAGPLNDNDPYPSNIVNAPNLSALLQSAGIPWKSYQEDIDLVPTTGGVNQPGPNALTGTVAPQSQWTVPLTSFSGISPAYTNSYNGSHQYNFSPKHDGQLFFTATNGGNDPSAANPEAQFYAPLQQLQTDLNNNTVARYSLITPDQYNDMHSSLSTNFTYGGVTYTPGDQEAIALGDNFLSQIIPIIEASQAYKNNGAIVIRFDETEGGNTTQFTLPEVVISPLAKGNAFASALPYTHSSDLKSMQELFGVNAPGGGFLGDANTAGTNDLSDLFNLPPAVTGISPAAGPAAGGTAVTITGANLVGATAVHFGSTAAAIVSNDGTRIVATAPAGAAGAVDVTVTTPGGTSAAATADRFTYTAAPAVTGITPTAGPVAGGTTVTITGANLAGAAAVHFGSTAATIVSDTGTQIVATSPAGAAGAVDVTVTTPGGTSAGSAADQFAYTAAPTVTGISPAAGPLAGGTAVTITGANLANATTVHFGATAATIVSDTGTQIVATSPAGAAGAVDVTVTTPGGTSAASAADKFTYAAPPTLIGYPQTAVGADAGGPSTVTVYNADQSVAYTADPFPGFTGGVRTSATDFNKDGVPDLAAGTGPGVTAQVVVIDGKTRQPLATLTPFEAAFTGGVFVTTGDVTGDGVPDLIVTADQGGGPVVVIYDGAALAKGQVSQLTRFFGIADPNFRGGARAAVGDVNGDGVGDVVVAAGFGGGPRVAVYEGKSAAAGNPVRLVPDFYAFEQGLRNGVYVTVGDLTGAGHVDLIFGGGPGGGPRVRATDPAVLIAAGGVTSLDDAAAQPGQLLNFFAGDPANRGGERVVVKNLDGDTKADLVAGPGTGNGSTVTTYLGKSLSGGALSQSSTLDPFPGFTGGVFVG